MKVLIGFTAGVLAGLVALTYLAPGQTQYETLTVYKDRVIVEQVMTTIDLDRIRDTQAIHPDLDEQLLYECAMALQRQTSEPLAGIVLYIQRYWQGDSCAAFDHQVRHGWY